MGRMTSHIFMDYKLFETTRLDLRYLGDFNRPSQIQVIKYLKVQFDHQGEIAFRSACVNPLGGHYDNHHHRKHYIPWPLKSTGTEIAKKRLARHNSALYNLMLHLVCIEFQTYIYIYEQGPPYPPHPARWFPPPVAGEGGNHQQPSHGVWSLYSAYNASVSIIRMDILYVI